MRPLGEWEERRNRRRDRQTEPEFALSITVHGAINFRRRRYCFLCRSIFAICRRRCAARQATVHTIIHSGFLSSRPKLDIFLSIFF